MHTNNFHHLDIKRGNIVHKKISKRSYSFHYIDFGLSLVGDIPIAQNSLFQNNYFAWPFETRFVHPLFESKQITNGSITEFYGEKAALYCQDLYPTEVFKDVNGTALGNVTLYKTLYNAVFDNPNYILRKTDIYSLGRVLSELYSLQFGHKMHYDTIFARKPSDVRNWTSISKLGSAEIVQWHTDVARDLSIPFFDLVKEMMNINMTIRINAEKALSTYKSLIPMFEKYCTAEQISKHLSYYTPHLAILEPPTPPPTPAPTPSNSTQMPLNVTNLFASSAIKRPKSSLKLIPSQVLKRLGSPTKKGSASRKANRRN
jgi:serine/threonine protein kinase